MNTKRSELSSEENGGGAGLEETELCILICQGITPSNFYSAHPLAKGRDIAVPADACSIVPSGISFASILD